MAPGVRVTKRTGPILLIDADVLRYFMAFSNTASIDWDGDGETTEVYQEDKAKADVEGYIEEMVDKFKARDYVLAMSCREHNFRKDVLDTYKLARHQKPKPALWHVLDRFIYETYADKIVERYGLEGDDILGLLATHPHPMRALGPRIVVSIDKDLKTIPCRLYNPMKPDLGVLPVTEHAANLFWMHQTLTGDATDNYSGCPKVGPKRADEALLALHEAHLDAPVEEHLAALWAAVVAVYESKGLTADDALTQARLARILRHGDYSYKQRKVNLWKPS